MTSRQSILWRWLIILTVLIGAILIVRRQSKPKQAESNITRPQLEQIAESETGAVPLPEDKPLVMSDILKIARQMKSEMEKNVVDYTAKLIKRERINGKLRNEDTMRVKIRHARPDAQPPIPFSVYLTYLPPSASVGREVIWVSGQNNDKLLTHELGLNLKLPTGGFLAMNGNKYPITDIGMLNLADKLIEKGSEDVGRSDQDIKIIENQMVEDRPCQLIQITNPNQLPELDYHVAQIYIDNELAVPIRYAAYTWPTQAGDPPQLEEEYTYLEVQTNVGLTDADFDPANPDYKFPK